MTTPVDKFSWAGGEISPSLYDRQDLAKQPTAAKRIENFAVSIEGTLVRVPGTRFVGTVADGTRPALMVPFHFSEDDSYTLVLNGGVMRVYRSAGAVLSGPAIYQVAHPWSDAELDGLRWAQSGNVMFFACPTRQPYTLTRNAVADWSFAPYQMQIVRGAMADQNVDVSINIVAGDVGGYQALTASADVFSVDDVGTVWRFDESDFQSIPLWTGNTNYNAGEFVRNNGRVYVNDTPGTTSSGPNAPVHDIGSASAGKGFILWRFYAPSYGFAYINLVITPRNAEATILTFLPKSVKDSGTYRWHRAAWSPARGWPSDVALRDNAIVWARNDEYWISNPGDFYSFEVKTSDDSSLHARLLAPDGSLCKIEWMLFSGVLVMGARDGEWIIRGPNPYDALTVANVRQDNNKNEGSRRHRPAIVDGGALYIGRSGDRMHFAAFDRLGESLAVEDTTKFARHILRGRAKEVVFQRDPNRLVWARDDAGNLFSLCWYLKEQVVGWSRRPFVNGAVESMTVIPSADASYSELWLVVRRVINGITRRYIEVLQPFFVPADSETPTAAGAWFVDSGLRYQGPPTMHVSGIDHLADCEVAIFADGRELPRQQIGQAHAVDLPVPASDVVVGLPITGRIKALGIDIAQEATRAKRKRAGKVFTNVVETFGGRARANDGQWEDILPDLVQAKLDVAGSPVGLATRGYPVATVGAYDDLIEIELLFDNAYPATVAAIAPMLEAGS